MNKKAPKQALDISGFEDLNTPSAETAVIEGAGTGKVETTQPTEKTESKKTITIDGIEYHLTEVQPPQPRSKGKETKKYWVHDDVDPLKEKRKRNVHGTAVNIPLYVEEFRIMDEAYQKYAKAEAGKGKDFDSFSEYTRKLLLKAFESKLTKDEVTAIESVKMNQINLKYSKKSDD